MLPFVEHNCGESKLKCIDCEGQVCPKCMVQCPVGNRCAKCTKRFTSHVLKVDLWSILRGLFGGIIAGLLFGLLEIFCPVGGFFILILVYFLGVLAGNIIFKLAGRKIGSKMAITAALGALIGSVCFVSPITLSFIIFLLGLVSPFLGWNFSWPGSRR
jgi:hypothetical protein